MRRPAASPRAHPAHWLLLVVVAAALLGEAGHGEAGQIRAQGSAAAWPVTESAAPSEPMLPGWKCRQSITLPAPGALAAVCRRSGEQANPELTLLLVERGGGEPRVRELSRLRDATQARMRLFAAPDACDDGKPCLQGLLLVDQRDESSCYGTQVVVLVGGRTALSIGFIDELRVADGVEVCVGPYAEVNSLPDGALITLPGPLARMDRHGRLRPLAEAAIAYSVAAARPALQRQPSRRATQ